MYDNGAQCWVQVMSWLWVKVEYRRGHFHEFKVFLLEIYNTYVFKVFPNVCGGDSRNPMQIS